VGSNKRDQLQRFLADRGIQSSPVHSPNHTHTFTKNFEPKVLPGVEMFSKNQLNIPVGWWVSTEDRAHIVDTITEFAKREL